MRRQSAVVLGLILFGLAARPAAAQQVPAMGTAATLDVATWNIESFGSASNGPADAGQMANVQAVIEQAGIDLWGVQEIADPADFAALLDALGPGYDGILATQSGTQRIGFLYKTDVFSNVVVNHLLTQFNYDFASRPPLQLQADVALPGATQRLAFIVLHMKAFSDQVSYERRVEAAGRLKNYLDFLRADDPIVVLGDFNDELGGSIRAGQPSPYADFLRDTASYFFPSLRIEEAGQATFCGSSTSCSGGSTIDHILITDELFPFYVAGSAERFDALLDAFDGTGGACGGEFVCTTSDHLPVLARFRFGATTAAEAAAVAEPVVAAPYPNPFREATTLSYTLARPAPMRLDVYDLLGRHVATPLDAFQPAGSHRAAFDAAGLPPGVYVLRLTAGQAAFTRAVVRLP